MSFPFRRCLVSCALLVLPWVAFGQSAQQTADLGQCALEIDAVIEECTIGYRTLGTLNEDRSNAVLFPTWFSGTSEDLLGQVGPDGLVDTSRYYVVLVDALSNGVSSSPSTSTAQPDSAFPVVSIPDMVDTQHRLLTETMNIDSLHAVIGLSMGGMQAFEWMVRYPSFIEKAVPIAGTPRLTAQDRLLWQAELRAFRTARRRSDRRQAMRTIAAIHTLHLRTPRQLATMDSTEARTFIEEQEQAILAFDPFDWAWQLKAMLRHDVTDAFGGSVSRAVDKVKASTLVVTVEQDHMVNPVPAQRFAEALGAEELRLESACGHLGPGCRQDTVVTTVQRFLRDD